MFNPSFLEQFAKNYKKDDEKNTINKNKEKEKDQNKKMNNNEIKSKNDKSNNNKTKRYSIAVTDNNINTQNESKDNKNQNVLLPNKGNKISNFIKEKLNIISNRTNINNDTNKNKEDIANKTKNININKSDLITKSMTIDVESQRNKNTTFNINNDKNIDKNNNTNKSQIRNNINVDYKNNLEKLIKNQKEKETTFSPNQQSTKQKDSNNKNNEKKEKKEKSSKELGKILSKSESSSDNKSDINIKEKPPQPSSKQMENTKSIDDTQSTSISSDRSSLTELNLDSISYSTFLEQENKNAQENKNIRERETFCEGFFVTSFPKKNGKVIENSFSFRSPCGHLKCAKLPSMKPEVIMRYPLNDTNNIEINNLASSICFPTGIKVCYFENNPSIMKDYVTPITNQKGERYYMMTYHFFYKMANSEFTKIYEENPLKHHLKRFGEAYLNLREEELTEKMVNEIQETLKYCEELGFRDYVYIPYCLCLISKYPYINEMEKCLQSIYYLMINQINNDNIELNKLIMFLIHSVPIPINRNSKLKFYIPYYNNGIEIACPKINDINIININVSMLFKWFSIDNIIIILRLILFEQKLLFVDDNYERLSTVIDIFISLIYPLQWIHTYIPIMSEEMLNYIETFLPFVNGVHNSLLPMIKNLIKESANEVDNSSSSSSTDADNEDIFYLIYITENRIGLSSEFKNKFRDEKKYIQDNIPNFPPDMEKDLCNKLIKVKNEINVYINTNNNNNNLKANKNKEKDLNKFDLKLRNIFIELFVEMFNDFQKYLCIIDNNDVVFNKKLFINDKQFKVRKFYEEFIDTQIFQQFIQTIAGNDDYNYFKTMILQNKKSNKNVTMNSNNKNDNYYYVIPDCFENINNDFKNIEKIMKEKCFINNIKTNDNKILPNNQRILTSIKNIDNNKYNDEKCSIYLLPQYKNNNNYNDNDKDMEKLNSNFLKKFENYNENDENNSGDINSKKKQLTRYLKNDVITEKEKDHLEEYIKDFTIKIFSSEDLNMYNLKTKTEMQNAISNTYGRQYFIKILLKNICSNNVVLLNYSCFNFLGTLIYNLILSTLKIEETDEILEQIINLIKSMNFFGKKEYKKNGEITITLWDIYKPKIQTLPKVMQINFWDKWYEIEYNNAEQKDDKGIQDIIYSICDLMISIELPKSFIKNVLQNLVNNIFGKDTEMSTSTFNVFIEKIINAKYISQVLI